jgi:N-acetyl-anhydromuramyl-L-alanine amidase AmpD
MSSHPLSRRALLGTGLAAVTVAAGVPLPGHRTAHAAGHIVPCDTWGARPPSEPVTVLSTGPNKIIVHHTATANSTDYSRSHADALARSIQRHHMDNRGFIDTGQHFTISRGGHVLEGRHRSLEVLEAGAGHVVGAHCTGQNPEAVGIENEGTYTSVAPPAALYDQLVTLCTDICRAYDLGPDEIYGHRDFDATACPGDVLYARLPTLRSDVAARLRGDSWPTVSRGATGERVRTVQYLLRQHGQELTVDGVFGSATETAVRALQRARGLTENGTVDRNTWPALIVTVRSGSAGEAVKAVQSQLNTRGHGLTVDGRFGPRTDAAVRDFQADSGLTVNGSVDPSTWYRLVS